MMVMVRIDRTAGPRTCWLCLDPIDGAAATLVTRDGRGETRRHLHEDCLSALRGRVGRLIRLGEPGARSWVRLTGDEVVVTADRAKAEFGVN